MTAGVTVISDKILKSWMWKCYRAQYVGHDHRPIEIMGEFLVALTYKDLSGVHHMFMISKLQ